MKSYAVIPVRKFSTTKLRLESVLKEEARITLTGALLKHVLSAIEDSRIDLAVVVASDVAEVEKTLKSYSRFKVVSESHHYGGVNLAMQDGLLEIEAGRANAKTLLMPSDLPLINGDALNSALSLLDNHDLIINPSTKRDGTNLLGFVRSGIIPLHYDDDSFTKHLVEAEARGLNYRILDWKEFSFDLDDEEDIKSLQSIESTNSFEALITKLDS
jgi:2-phospho-L-lactate/phosphoenolpyruvate guanylyltransferase